MPKPTAEQLAEARRTGPIRLECRAGCFEQHDGIHEVPAGWTDVEEVRSLEVSMTTYEDGDGNPPWGYSVFDWETHTGVCPECQDVPEPLIVSNVR